MSSNGMPTCRSPLRGKITCILGPMFSGKTTELLRMHDRQIIAKRKCVLVKYAGDTRYDPELVATHAKMIGQGITVKAHKLSEVEEHIFDPSVQVVSIDEGQFFSDCAETCDRLATMGKVVYVAALSGTFERKVEVIGGQDTYQALCRSCYIEESCRREETAIETAFNENRAVASQLCREGESSEVPRKVFRLQFHPDN
ncbi:thymidine kinase [Ostertagia ostertagi]